MKVFSLAREGQKLSLVEVELILTSGLPQIHFLGLPDQVIKESIHRIKTAIRHQGFDFPKTHQIVVNIRPSHVKKSSRGLELAVAAALLWETSQVSAPADRDQLVVYGELGLHGEVHAPDDLMDFENDSGFSLLTGPDEKSFFGAKQIIRNLAELSHPETVSPNLLPPKPHRPELGLHSQFPLDQARLLQVLALGGHHALLAGPSGSGKSHLAKSLSSFLDTPNPHQLFKTRLLWRPVIQPHHSVSALSMIGGGVPPKPGEISKAHGGILIMDELLEFSTAAQEALREPLEERLIRITRGMKSEVFAADVQLIATTNLCPCGDWVPGSDPRCRFSRHRCMSYQQKLSGPFLDRFEILFFTKRFEVEENEGSPRVSGQNILLEIDEVRQWQKKMEPRRPQRWDEFTLKNLVPKHFSSRRRQTAFKKVCETMADLSLSEEVRPEHIEETLELVLRPFEKLSRGF